MFRRLLIVIIIVLMPRISWCQVQLIINLNTAAMLYQGWYTPYKSLEFNNKELTNEGFIQLNTYFLIVFSDFVIEAETRYLMGWCNIGFLSLFVLVNLLLISRQHLINMSRWCKLKKLKRQQQEMIRMKRRNAIFMA